MSSPVTMLFADGHTGEADWRRYGGEPQPQDQAILLCMEAGDAVGYRLDCGEAEPTVKVVSYGGGNLKTQYLPESGTLWLTCETGSVQAERLMVTAKE